jgi:polyhydroxyalkanoate synthesis regulator phasin
MEDLFRKFIYTGVGLVALTAEKLQENIDELVGKGKLTEDEGKKLVEDFINNAESRKDEFEAKLKSVAENVMEGLTLPTSSEIEALNKRLEALEAKIDALNKEQGATKPAAKTAKKTATKRSTRSGSTDKK